MSKPVTPKRIALASERLANADVAAEACRKVGLPFWAACALLEKESGGKNVWGGADASPFVELNRAKVPVNADSFAAFYVGVRAGLVPTGVGPCQITYAGALKGGRRDGGYFRIMLERGLDPSDLFDNMVFGFETLVGHHERHGSWRTAGRLYNGADSYGVDLVTKCNEWRDRLNIRGRDVA